jgi:hypothetical protein
MPDRYVVAHGAWATNGSQTNGNIFFKVPKNTTIKFFKEFPEELSFLEAVNIIDGSPNCLSAVQEIHEFKNTKDLILQPLSQNQVSYFNNNVKNMWTTVSSNTTLSQFAQQNQGDVIHVLACQVRIG